MPGWSRGVTVSTLDSESSDRGSNPRETCEQPLDLIAHPCPAGWLLVMAVLLWWGSCRQLQAPSTANVGGDLRCSYARPDYMPQTWQAILRCVLGWSRGVTVSTLDSESSDRGSNPRGTSLPVAAASVITEACHGYAASTAGADASPISPAHQDTCTLPTYCTCQTST